MKRSLILTTVLGVAMLAGCSVEEPTPTTPVDGVGGGSDTESPTTTPTADGGATSTAPPEGGMPGDEITVDLMAPEGAEVGTVTFSAVEGGTRIMAVLSGLEPGFHGFHIHETPVCDPDAAEGPFMSAGGHWNPEGTDHGEHAGDLPTLLVTQDGAAELTVTTDAFTVEEITADGGRAVMVHAGRDNQANIPGRYTSDDAEATTGPDDTTRRTGDAGDRVACGELSE